MRIYLASLACVAALIVRAHAQVEPPIATQSHAITLTLATNAKAVPLGGVVLLTVHSSQPLTELKAQALGRAIWFWSDVAHTTWQGLVAPGLNAKPASYTVTANGKSSTGTATATFSLRVEPKQFQTRRLTVDPNFVNPPDSEGPRIAREVKLMAEVFSRVTPERLWHGPWEVPVPGEATSSFGRLSVLNGESRGRHQGADFRAATGTPVHAPNGGRVAVASDLYFSGNTVIIDHGLGMFSLLAHLSRISVEAGSTVSRGDVLGDSGATGRVTGPHLHWALRLGDASIDPLALISTLSTIEER